MRVGVPSGIDQELIAPMLKALEFDLGENALVSCDSQPNLIRAFNSGFIDAAFLIDVGAISATVAAEWDEQWHWVKAPNFLLSPGAPVPIVGWTGSLSLSAVPDGVAQSQRRVFGNVHQRRTQPAQGGSGCGNRPDGRFGTLDRGIEFLRRTRKSLSPLSLVHGGVYLADGFDRQKVKPLLRALEPILRPAQLGSSRREPERSRCFGA